MDESREAVQRSSQEIADLIRRREHAVGAEREQIDREIELIRQTRADDFNRVILAENPNIEVVDAARGIYRVAMQDENGGIRYLYGSIEVVWNLSQVPRSAFNYMDQLRSMPAPGSGVSTRIALGGSGIQGEAQPFPGDLDFSEDVEIRAENTESAARSLLETIREFIRRNMNNENIEFVRIIIRGLSGSQGTADFILSPANDAVIIPALVNLNPNNGGNINSFWRARVEEGRFIEITKILNIRAINQSSGESLFGTRPGGERYQSAYFERPDSIPQSSLGEYADIMRRQAISLIDDEIPPKYLKAAKRAFNYFMSTGNLEAREAIQPVFSSPQARVNQQVAVLEAVSDSLRRRTRSRILSFEEAQNLLLRTANVIESELPANGAVSPAEIAQRLRLFANQEIERDENGLLKPKDRLSNSLRDEVIEPAMENINGGIRLQVEPLIDRYVR